MSNRKEVSTMSTMGERLRNARENKGLLQSQLANLIGVKSSAVISNWEKDTNKPDAEKIVRICEALNISLSYLLDYHGENPIKLSNTEIEHIKKYRVLDEHGKEAVDGLLDTEYKRYQKIQETITSSSSVPTMKGNIAPLQEQKIIYLPEPIQSASAGTGQIADDDTAEQVAVYYNEKTSKADYIMRVSGDSMEPKFMNGDRVLIRSQPAVEIGEIGIFIVDGEQYVKIYRGSYLESLNPQYNNIEVSERSFCRGKVIGVLDPEWIAE